MKAFVLTDENSKPVAVAMDEGMAMDMLFTLAIQDGRIDEEAGVFDFGKNGVLEMDIDTLVSDALLTDTELTELEEKGAVLL